jgi:hypothetical protein
LKQPSRTELHRGLTIRKALWCGKLIIQEINPGNQFRKQLFKTHAFEKYAAKNRRFSQAKTTVLVRGKAAIRTETTLVEIG